MIKSMQVLFFIFTIFHQGGYAQQVHSYGDNKKAGKFIHINGVNLYYETYGSGKPLILVHGNGTATAGWAQQIEYFSKNYTVYSIDCRGRGKTELGNDSLTYIQQAKDLARFIELLKLDSVNIIGKSDGAIVALLAAIHYPAHIEKIVAFSANLQPDTSALYNESVAEIHNKRLQADSMLAAKNAEQNWLIVQQRYRLMEFQPHITAAELQRIKVPVLVMSTDRDVVRESHTFFIYRNIPHAHLAILNNETHHLAKQNAKLFNETAERFLSRPYQDHASRFKR